MIFFSNFLMCPQLTHVQLHTVNLFTIFEQSSNLANFRNTNRNPLAKKNLKFFYASPMPSTDLPSTSALSSPNSQYLNKVRILLILETKIEIHLQKKKFRIFRCVFNSLN